MRECRVVVALELIMANIRKSLLKLSLLLFCLPLSTLLSLDSNELNQRLNALNETLELHFVPHSHMVDLLSIS